MLFFGERTSALVNAILLTIVYICGVGTMSVLAKITGKKFLDLEIDKDQQSYWRETEKQTDTLYRYYRQF